MTMHHQRLSWMYPIVIMIVLMACADTGFALLNRHKLRSGSLQMVSSHSTLHKFRDSWCELVSIDPFFPAANMESENELEMMRQLGWNKPLLSLNTYQLFRMKEDPKLSNAKAEEARIAQIESYLAEWVIAAAKKGCLAFWIRLGGTDGGVTVRADLTDAYIIAATKKVDAKTTMVVTSGKDVLSNKDVLTSSHLIATGRGTFKWSSDGMKTVRDIAISMDGKPWSVSHAVLVPTHRIQAIMDKAAPKTSLYFSTCGCTGVVQEDMVTVDTSTVCTSSSSSSSSRCSIRCAMNSANSPLMWKLGNSEFTEQSKDAYNIELKSKQWTGWLVLSPNIRKVMKELSKEQQESVDKRQEALQTYVPDREEWHKALGVWDACIKTYTPEPATWYRKYEHKTKTWKISTADACDAGKWVYSAEQVVAAA